MRTKLQRAFRGVSVCVLPLLVGGCSGELSQPGAGGSGVTPTLPGQSGEMVEMAPESALPGAGGLRRIPVRSLHATLDTLFPDLADQRPTYPPDVFEVFDTELNLDNGLAFVETTALVMSDLVRLARRTPGVWSQIHTCAAGADTATCLGEFYDNWVLRLLRRAGDPTERAEFVALSNIDLGDTDDALAVALEALLRHPEFTHRVELGLGTAAQRYLAPQEIQSRLAFFLWGEAPDDALRAMSPPDLLDDTARLTFASQMLGDPRAERQIRDYHAQWIGFATMSRAELKQDMWEEAAALIRRVVLGGAPYEQLFLSEESYLTPQLAEHYDLPSISQPGWVSTAGSGRLGIFGQGAFLQAFSNIADTSPVKRGKNVLSRFLCRHLEVPQDLKVDVDAQPEAGQCRTEFFRDVHAQGVCAGCHEILDGVGFSLEIFDREGKARSHELDAPDCALDGIGELDGVPLQGADGLARAIAGHTELDRCVTEHVAEFVLGTDPEATDAGKAWVDSLTEQYVTSGGQFKELLLAIVSRPEFVQVATN